MYRATLCLLLLSITSGCMTFIVEGDVPKTPDSETATETVHGSLYKHKWQQWTKEKCLDRKGIARVEYHINAIYLLTSVVTLGLYVPQTVTWWCDGTKPDDDSELYVPGSA
jgi:hypothetical protein